MLDLLEVVNALSKSQPVIAFSLDGRALDATEGCLSAMGYSWVDRRGKHHWILVHAQEQRSPDPVGFWTKLAVGEDGKPYSGHRTRHLDRRCRLRPKLEHTSLLPNAPHRSRSHAVSSPIKPR